MRTFGTSLAALAMCCSLFTAATGRYRVVSPEEASTVWGADTTGCVMPGTPVSFCMLDQTCNPMVTPPVSGLTQFNETGSSVGACYMSTTSALYCPCGTSSYYLQYTGSASCYTGS